MNGGRMNQNYRIIQSVTVGEDEYVLGENTKAPNSFVTWQCKDGDNYFWGHYMDDFLSASKDLYMRAIGQIEYLQEEREERKMEKLDIRPLKQEEQLYCYRQSRQITVQTGCIGSLSGDFGQSGREYQGGWEDLWADQKTEAFKEVLNQVVSMLGSGQYGLLEDKGRMEEFVRGMPEAAFERDGRKEHGFRVDREGYAFLIRCDSAKGLFSCFCYQAKNLDRHIERAKQGIRFIDPHYKELFRIADGDGITIKTAWGERKSYICRFIDETHTEVGRSLYHICEFAEIMQRNGSTYEPENGGRQGQKNKDMER